MSAADGDSVTTAKARRRLAAGMCKRLHELLTCLRVLVGTIVAMPAVIDQQVGLDQHAHKQQICRAAVFLSEPVPGRADNLCSTSARMSDSIQQHSAWLSMPQSLRQRATQHLACVCCPCRPLVLLPQTRIATRAYKLLATLTKAYIIPKKPPTQGAAEAAATACRSVVRQLLTIQHAPGRVSIAQKEHDSRKI